MSRGWAWAIVLPLALAGSRAGAETLRGSIGLGYSSVALDPPELARRTRHVLLQNYALALAGQPLKNGYLGYQLRCNYSNLAGREPQARLSTSNLTLAASVALMQRTAVPIRLEAQRERRDTTSTQAESEFLGVADVTMYGGQAAFRKNGYPNLTLDVRDASRTVRNGFGERVHSEELIGALHASQALRAFSYSVDGRETVSRSSLQAASYTSQYLSLTQESKLTDRVQFWGRGLVFQRRAADDAVGNPDYLSSNASLSVRARHASKWTTYYAYNQARFARLQLGADDVSSVSHSGTFRLGFQPDAVWIVTGGATLQRAAYEVLTERSQAWTETTDVRVEARPQLGSVPTNASLTGTLGLTQPDGGEAAVVNGVDGQLGATTSALPGVQGSANALVGWQQDHSSIGGRALRQQLDLTATTMGTTALRGGLTLNLGAQQRKHALLGRASEKLASLQGNATWRSVVAVNLTARYQDGVSRYLQDPVTALPLPSSYNVVTKSLDVLVRWQPLRDLMTSAHGQTMHLRAVDRSQIYEIVEVRLDYRIGLMSLSMWDRLTFESSSGRRVRSNVLYALVSRSFEVNFLQ